MTTHPPTPKTPETAPEVSETAPEAVELHDTLARMRGNKPLFELPQGTQQLVVQLLTGILLGKLHKELKTMNAHTLAARKERATRRVGAQMGRLVRHVQRVRVAKHAAEAKTRVAKAASVLKAGKPA
jgi:hypothetical protein